MMKPIEPVGTRETMAFVAGRRKSGYQPLDMPVYPPHPNGERVQELRLRYDLGLRETAGALKMTASQLSGLEFGRYGFDTPEEWTELHGQIDAFGKVREGGGG